MNYYCSVENSGNKPTNFITRPQLKLQGPRPTALTVSKSSKKAMAKKKPNPSNPVIVYLISPKIIHVQPEEFMGLVQRLTGNDHQGPRRVNHIVANSQSCSNSSTSGLSQGDQYFIESQQTLTSKRKMKESGGKKRKLGGNDDEENIVYYLSRKYDGKSKKMKDWLSQLSMHKVPSLMMLEKSSEFVEL